MMAEAGTVAAWIEGIEAMRRAWTMMPPLLAKLRVRPLAVIEAEIRRATVPGLRPEQV